MDTIPKLDFKKMPEVYSLLDSRGYYPMFLMKDENSPEGVKGIYGCKNISKLVGLTTFTTRDYEKILVDGKKTYFEFRKFMHMVYKGKISTLDFLYCPDDLVYYCSDLMRKVRDSKEELLNINSIYKNSQTINDKNYKNVFRDKPKNGLKFNPKAALDFIKISCNMLNLLECGEWKLDTSEFLPDLQETLTHSPEEISKGELNSRLVDLSLNIYRSWSVRSSSITKDEYNKINDFILKYLHY